jgi:hypothetical protein
MFFSNRYRPNNWPFYILGVFEFPLTVALLALFGIADPDTYRTRLWQDGSNNGFNSNPNAALYAAANYRPYTTPKVWSQLYVHPSPPGETSPTNIVVSITSYNVVIVVLSMFIMLAKVRQSSLPLRAFQRWSDLLPGRHVHSARLAPNAICPRPRHPHCALRSLDRLSSRIRYERSATSAARPTMVHHQILLGSL